MTRTRVMILSCAAISIALLVLLLGNSLEPLRSPFENMHTSELRLIVDGLVQQPLNLTFDELANMPKSTVSAELYCVDNPKIPVVRGNWTGVRLGFLLQEAGISNAAVKAAFYAIDGYKTDLTISTAFHENIITAFERDGGLLPEGLRLVAPGKWGYKWISGLTHIQLVNYDFKGTWESRGYSDEADVTLNP
jgi:DMSO/TMAO reductase YedYZ molybdopterin-dependent catalytic subunit